jgi:hypothetical protein
MDMKKRVVLVALGSVGVIGISLFLILIFWLGPHPVQQIVSGTFEISEPADVQNAAEITNECLSLQYPGNWRIDTADPDYDPDKYFDINAPGQGKVMVHVFPPRVTPQQGVDAMVQNLKKLVRNAKETPYESWGPHTGYGIELTGFILVGSGRIRSFGLGNSQATVVIVELRYDEDEANNKAGYELISQTFRLKGL